MKAAWKFYVYELVSSGGAVMYVGKGSGYRLRVQIKDFGLSGYEVARFRVEKDAYAFERDRIAEVQPLLNIHPGGNGSTVTVPRKARVTEFEREYQRIGGRVMAARFLLNFAANRIDPSNLDKLRQVAYG